MKGNPDVIKVLNKVLRKELTGINQYFIHAKMWINSHRAVALQGGVEVAAALTEVVVGRVAQSEHRIFHGSEIKAVAMHQHSQKRAASSGGSPSPWVLTTISTQLACINTLGWQCAMSLTSDGKPARRSEAASLFASLSALPVTVP